MSYAMVALSPDWTSTDRQRRGRRNRSIARASLTPVDKWSELAQPTWTVETLMRINRVGELLDGWDGEGARAVTDGALEKALRILVEIMSPETIPPQVVPVADGGLQLEWHCAGVDLEVYIASDGAVGAWSREGAREWEEDNVYPRLRLSKELSLLTRSLCE